MSELFGRISRGINESEFEYLSDKRDRRVIFFISPKEVDRILSKEDDLGKLRAIGLRDKDIRKYLAQGKTFRMYTIPKDEQIAKLATWDNLLDTVMEAYPEIAGRIGSCREGLKNKSFDEIVAEAGYDPSDIDAGDPRYMSLAAYMESDGSLINTRAFLLHELNVNRTFAGNGFTRPEDGSQGIEEYIGLNRPTASIPGLAVRYLSVSLPGESSRELRNS